MGSPFPGMDPYIEASRLWEDFHSKLIGEIERALSSLVPQRYLVRTGERSYVALALDDDEERRSWVPDVTVAAKGSRRRTARKPRRPERAAPAPSEPAPVIMQAVIKAEYREPFLEIRQVEPGHKLITAVELLSPSNKRPNTKGWRLYYRKRLAFLSGYASFVEIDLLRRGRRMPMASAWRDSPYYLLMCRKKEAPRCTVWPAYCTQRLPALPIPLAPPDADIWLDLQPLVDTVYARSRYEVDIDYDRPLNPPLGADEAALVTHRRGG